MYVLQDMCTRISSSLRALSEPSANRSQTVSFPAKHAKGTPKERSVYATAASDRADRAKSVSFPLNHGRPCAVGGRPRRGSPDRERADAEEEVRGMMAQRWEQKEAAAAAAAEYGTMSPATRAAWNDVKEAQEKVDSLRRGDDEKGLIQAEYELKRAQKVRGTDESFSF